MKSNWDERYASEDYIYGTEPNAFFREHLALLPPGRILLPADGEGRNAVYAASRGWDVHAFDQSGEGRMKALALAAARGVSIHYDIADLADAEAFHLADSANTGIDSITGVVDAAVSRGAFDAVGLFFVHMPEPLRHAVHARCVAALRQGGSILLEAFTPDQLRNGSGGPKDTALLYTAELLRDDFAALDITLLEEVTIPLDEGALHRGEACVVRLAGRKT